METPTSSGSSASAERRGRLWELAAPEAEALVLTDPISVGYLTGFFSEPHERLTALVLEGSRARLLVPALEAENARGAAGGVTVEAWSDGQDPLSALASWLQGAARVGVEADRISLLRARALEAAIASRLVDIARHVRGLRMLKDEDEIRRLQKAAALTDLVWERVQPVIRRGMSELELDFELSGLIREASGLPSFESLVQFGPDSALPHLAPGARCLEAQDVILLDFGVAFGGYRADITRVAVAGPASKRLQEVHAAVLGAKRAAASVLRPGITTGEVYRAARQVLEEAGLASAFTHRLGHGLGLEIHEAPSLEPDGQQVLEPGMVVTIEPGCYFVGWGGVRIEDDYLITEGEARPLTVSDPGLVSLPGG